MGLGLLAFAPLAGCSPTDLRWSEEVKLHDGRIIVVKRREERTLTGFPVQSRGYRKYYYFCYPPMGIQWKSRPAYFPETFDIVDGRAYAKVSLQGNCELCLLQGFPKTSAVYFRWVGMAWKKIPYEEYPQGLRFNMMSSAAGSTPEHDLHGLVTIAQKESRGSEVYRLMRENPAVTGLNDRAALNGRTCDKCGPNSVVTDRSPEIFLQTDADDCR